MEKWIEVLNDDLANEYKHMHFYLANASKVKGDYGVVREWLKHEAQSEMGHVLEFSNMIEGLGGKAYAPNGKCKEYLISAEPEDILAYALKMELEVVNNFANRIEDAGNEKGASLSESDSAWLVIFYEKQLESSREDIDKIRKMMKN